MRVILGAGALGLGLALALGMAPGVAQAMPEATWHQRGIDMAPRLQWNANSGYCGETSFISAGMYFGQYASQWTVRATVSPGMPQTDPRSQLLLGVHTQRDARALRLATVEFPSSSQRSTQQFLRWVKARFLAGDVVIIGVFNNVNTLGEPKSLADPDYDHITPVMGIGSGRSLALAEDGRRYYGSDNVTISDNGLFTVGPNYPFLFTYRMNDFMLTRQQANALGGPVYSVRSTPANYGTSVTGVLDPEGVTIPVRLTSTLYGEGIQDQARLAKPPPALPMSLTATVTIPDTTRSYVVYLYDDFASVPATDFNAHADRAARSWRIPAGQGSTWQVTLGALTSDTLVFRAVPESAS